MGNTQSVRLRRRHAAASELLHTKPSGLYASCGWDARVVRRIIVRGELAPRWPGADDPHDDVREECPICMLVYPALNAARCCEGRMCTECYLQVRPVRGAKVCCPFCKAKKLEVAFKGFRDGSVLDKEEEEERNAAEGMKRAAARDSGRAEAAGLVHPALNLSGPADTACQRLHAHGCDCNAPAIDAQLLESMASEVTFSSPSASSHAVPGASSPESLAGTDRPALLGPTGRPGYAYHIDNFFAPRPDMLPGLRDSSASSSASGMRGSAADACDSGAETGRFDDFDDDESMDMRTQQALRRSLVEM